MLNVTDETKKIYERDGVHKSMRIYFPDLDLTYENDRIVSDTFQLKESINGGGNLEFVGCIASVMSVELADLKEDVKGQRIEVYVTAEGTEEIPLFHGKVDSAKKQSYKNHKQIEAYDKLYELSEIDIASWYNNHKKTTIIRLFEDLIDYLGVEVDGVSFINGDLPAYCMDSQVAESLAALDLLKSICQINGVFGRINRKGKFETISLNSSEDLIFDITDHENMQHEEYAVKLIDSVIIRESASDGGIGYGEGTNSYVIQGNMFAIDLTSVETATAAKNIYGLISGVTYIPFDADTYGLPFIECGDQVSYQDLDLSDFTATRKNFFVISRTLTGINGMRDNFSAEGAATYDNITSDISTNISSIKSQMGEYNLIRFKYQNFRDISVGDTEVFLCQIDYKTRMSRPMLLGEMQLNVKPGEETVDTSMTIDGTETKISYTKETPVEVSIRYTLDTETIEYQPKDTFCTGNHLLHLLHFLGDLGESGTFGIYMTATGGTVTIPEGGLNVGIVGQGKLSAAVEWNGVLELEDTVGIVNVDKPREVKFLSFKDDVTFSVDTPHSSDIVEKIGMIKVEMPTVKIASFNDEITCETEG